MITSIISLILSIPKLLELTQKLVAYLSAQIDEVNKKKFLQDLESGVQKSKVSKDTSDLEALLNPEKKKKK